MADHVDEEPRSFVEGIIHEVKEKLHGDPSSDSDSDSDKVEHAAEAVKNKIFRIFGREKPVHQVLGGGYPADVILWRNKKVSGGLLAGVTVIWLLFEVFEYFLITAVCYGLIISLTLLFVSSYASGILNKPLLRIPEVSISEELATNVALRLRFEINRALASLRSIALGKDLKLFLTVIAGLWVLSIIGSCCNFLGLFYIVFILLHTVPALYEKYEDKVDPLAEKAWIEIKKQYTVFDAKVVSKVLEKIPKGLLKDKLH